MCKDIFPEIKSSNSKSSLWISLKNKRTTNSPFDSEKLQYLINKRKTRNRVSLAIFLLLAIQNGFIYWLTYYSIKHGFIQQMQLFIISLIAGTLTETYFLCRLIVKWLFMSEPHKPD